MNKELLWVDEFIANVKPYIYVRLEDNLLIKRPNNAQKLNATGAVLLKSLLDGTSIKQIIKKCHNDKQKILEIAQFITAVKQSLEGSLDVFNLSPAVEVKPFEMKFSKYPVLSELAITYRCNLKCSFCYAGCNLTANPIGNLDELNTQQYKQILDAIFYNAKVPSVSFTGGEPTLRKDLPQLISYAKKLGMRVNLISNGTLIDAVKAKQLVKAGLDSAQISLEGVTAATHNTIVGMKGAYEKSIAAIEHIKALGIHVHTNTTLSQQNLNEALLFPQFIKSLGLNKFSMNLIIPAGSGSVNNNMIIKYEDCGGIIKQIIEKSNQADVEFMWYSPLPMCMFNTIPHKLGNKGCAACDGLLSVAPNGDVLPCASYNLSVGNLLKQPFEDIWQSKQACFFRDKQFAHEICRQCENIHICNGACPLYWREVGYSELLKINQTETINTP